MKKALAMALGAVLVAGSAVPAAAATQVDFSGFYRANFFTHGNLGYTGDDNLNDNFFLSRLRLNVNFQATDEVSVHWRFQAPGAKAWGVGGHSDSLQSRFYYGQVVQDWGTVRVGKMAGGIIDEFGLSTLGWAPSVTGEFTYIAPFEASGENEGIQYSNSWDNGFSMKTSFSRIKSNWRNASTGFVNADSLSSDFNKDRYQVEGAYQWDGGGAALNVMYERDATGDSNNITDANRLDKTNAWYINPAVMHSWGAFSFHAEAKFGFGESQFYNGNLASNHANYLDDADAEGQGFYLDFDYNYGPGRVNLAGWWVSGNDVDDNDADNNAIVAIAEGNFYPLITAYGYQGYGDGPSQDTRQGATGAIAVANNGGYFTSRTGIINISNADAATLGLTDRATALGTDVSDVFDAGGGFLGALTDINGAAFTANNAIDFQRRTAFNNDAANHWALMLSGQHAFTDEVRFNYAVGYMALNNPNFRIMDGLRVNNAGRVQSVSFYNQDKELGWEIDLGVNIQLLDNLAFYSSVGYMFTGDAYQSVKGYDVSINSNGDRVINAEFEDADDAYSWLNALVFSF